MAASKKIDPAKRVDPKVYAAALKVVNKLLTKLGHKAIAKLPSGVPDEADACPLQTAMQKIGVHQVTDGDSLVAEILFPGTQQLVELDLTQLLTEKEMRTVDKFIEQFDESDANIESELRDHKIIGGWKLDPSIKAMAKVRGIKV